MRAGWRRFWVIPCAALLVSGCTVASTDLYPTSPSATSQLLVFRALERAVARLDVGRLRDRRVTLEVVSQLGDDRFATTYLETWLRTHGVKVGGDVPDLRLQIYLLALGTDKGQSFIGIPPFQMPVLAIPVPEIAIFKWIRNRGRADVRVYAFDPKTDALVDLLPETTGRSKFDDFTVLIVVGFSVTDVNDPVLLTPRAPDE